MQSTCRHHASYYCHSAHHMRLDPLWILLLYQLPQPPCTPKVSGSISFEAIVMWLPKQAWVTARAEKDFSKFAPILEEWVALVRESSQLVDPSRPAYDVALEEFEKGMTSARLDEVFTQVSTPATDLGISWDSRVGPKIHAEQPLKGCCTRWQASLSVTYKSCACALSAKYQPVSNR